MTARLFSFGHGYVARGLAARLTGEGWQVTGTTRTAERMGAIAAAGVVPALWPSPAAEAALEGADHLLISAAPGPAGDSAASGPAGDSAAPGPAGDALLAALGDRIAARAGQFRWVGYLSTTGVYGDRQGEWVSEDDPPAPGSARTRERVKAENAWLSIPGLPVHVFRLAGIYGPGRGPFAKVRNGTARRIMKPGQMFGRIHLDDIVQVLAASIARPDPGRIYNVTDDEPAPPEAVIEEAARLLGLPLPPLKDFATAEMTPMARSFYLENRRVRNDRIRTELGVTLLYPGYREGLAALMKAESG